SHGELESATAVASFDRPTEAELVTEAKTLLRYAVVLGSQFSRFLGCLVCPLLVAGSMADYRLNRKPGAQLRPAIVLFECNANWHTLHDFGEFARHDVAWQQGELGASRFIDPQHTAVEWFVKGINMKLDGHARCYALKACLLHIRGDIEKIGI